MSKLQRMVRNGWARFGAAKLKHESVWYGVTLRLDSRVKD